MLSLLKVRFVLKQTIYQNQNNKAGMFFCYFIQVGQQYRFPSSYMKWGQQQFSNFTTKAQNINAHIKLNTSKHSEKYAVKHSVQIQIQIRDWFWIFKSVTHSNAFDGSEVLGPFLQKRLGQLKTKTTSACIQLN